MMAHPEATHYREASQSPSHISKMVLSTIKIGPPDLTKSRTFTLRFRLAL